MTLDDIAEELRRELGKHFATVRVSAVQTPEQFMTELEAITPDKLPGVIIVFDNFNNDSADAIEEYRFTLVAVDRFYAAADERARRILKTAAEVMSLFPSDGRQLGTVYVHPTDCSAATVDPQYAALALGIVCKQAQNA